MGLSLSIKAQSWLLNKGSVHTPQLKAVPRCSATPFLSERYAWCGVFVVDVTETSNSVSLCSPHSYVFQPENAMPIGTFIDEKDDVELLDILPILMDLQNVRQL